jgi:hypothetical protein
VKAQMSDIRVDRTKVDKRNETVTSALSGFITVSSPRIRSHLDMEPMSPQDIFLSVGCPQP